MFLTEGGYVSSRRRAQELIEGGCVSIDGKTIKKSSAPISEGEHRVCVEETLAYVSRGGLKLEAALDRFLPNIKGLTALDIGASTGGFTDCLLRRGAKKVFAIDAGYGQLARTLSEDPRVISIERFNARDLTAGTIGESCDIAVMDVSFISQTYILPGVASVLRPGGHFISLIKPQFEAGKSAIGKNGIVHNAAYRFLAVKRVLHTAETLGLSCIGLMRSPIKGGDGNVEYLAAFEMKGSPILISPLTDAQIKHLTSQD